MKKVFFCVFALLLTASSLFAQKNKPYYHEDLYSLRPRLTVPIDTAQQISSQPQRRDFQSRFAVTSRVDSVLDSVRRFLVTRKFVDGFTIQIYSGQKREDAMNSKKKLITEAPDINSELEYNQPNFRVRIGNYYSRLEAQRDLQRLKKIFPNAILVPQKILLR